MEVRHFRSQTGSSLAVSTVAATLQTFLRDSVASNSPVPFVPEQVHELKRKIVSGWLSAVLSDLDLNPFTDAELATLEKLDGGRGGGGREFSGTRLRRPILRPLIGWDKTEIMAEARRIHTLAISELPDQDCCTLLTPQRVETRARIDDLRRIEGRLDAEDLAAELALSAQEYRQ